MIGKITLHWPPVIEFGGDKLNTLPDHLEGCSRVFLLVDPPLREQVKATVDLIRKRQINVMVSDGVVPEPPIHALKGLLKPVREYGPDAVVGIGGGSAMDMAKLVSVLYSGRQQAEEIIGINNIQDRDLRLITVATTAGTGSEVTPIAVLTDTEQHLKKGVVSPHIIPDVAIVDPNLTLSLPPSVTAATGMDAMTHCVEAYTNCHSHPVIDMFALEGISLIGSHLEAACKNGKDFTAREALALGSLYGGFCLGPVNTAAVHALAYPLGGEFKISHGVSNSVLLPFIMQYNLPSCTEKYSRIGRILGASGDLTAGEQAKQAILRIRTLAERCGIPGSLKALDIPGEAIPQMAEAAMKVTRLLANNPRTLNRGDAEHIFRQAYQGTIDIKEESK